MHYFQYMSSASGGFTPCWDFRPRNPLICPPLEKILQAPTGLIHASDTCEVEVCIGIENSRFSFSRGNPAGMGMDMV